MSRVLLLAVLLCSPLWAAAVEAPASNFDTAMKAMLEKSRDAKQGLVFHVNGHEIPGLVKEVLADAVVVANQTHGRIVIRMAEIDAVAAN